MLKPEEEKKRTRKTHKKNTRKNTHTKIYEQQKKTTQNLFHFEINIFKNDLLNLRICPGSHIKAIPAKNTKRTSAGSCALHFHVQLQLSNTSGNSELPQRLEDSLVSPRQRRSTSCR